MTYIVCILQYYLSNDIYKMCKLNCTSLGVMVIHVGEDDSVSWGGSRASDRTRVIFVDVLRVEERGSEFELFQGQKVYPVGQLLLEFTSLGGDIIFNLDYLSYHYYFCFLSCYLSNAI